MALNPSVAISFTPLYLTCPGQWCLCAGREPTKEIWDRAKSVHFLRVAQSTTRIAAAVVDAMVDASHQAHCDEDFSECRTKEGAKLAELGKRTRSIDSKTARKRCCFVAGIFGRALLPRRSIVPRPNERNLDEGIEGVRFALGAMRDNHGAEEKAFEI